MGKKEIIISVIIGLCLGIFLGFNLSNAVDEKLLPETAEDYSGGTFMTGSVNMLAFAKTILWKQTVLCSDMELTFQYEDGTSFKATTKEVCKTIENFE